MEKAVFSLNGLTPLPAVLNRPEPFPFDRVYLGTEICERLAPRPRALAVALAAAAASGTPVTLVTPARLSDGGLDVLERQLLAPGVAGVVDEVVFNDWGALEVICELDGAQPVLGRALHRMKRDPRIGVDELTAAELEVLRSSHVTNDPWRSYLRSRGVERVECDSVPQGIDIDFAGLHLHASLYLPFIPVSFSRTCPQAASHRSGRARYALNGSCRLECRDYSYQPESLNVVMIGRATYIVQESVDRCDLRQFDRIVRVVP